MKNIIKKTIETYNEIAKIYADYTFNCVLQYYLNELISLVPKNARVLDVGCGSGRDVQYFLEYNLSPIGIDISHEMINEAKTRVPTGDFKKMDMRNLKFKENTFDAIWACASLYHITRKELPSVLQDFNKLLKDKGLLFISVKEGDGSKIIRKEKYKDLPRLFVYYNKSEIEKLINENGFSIIKSKIEKGSEKTNWITILCRKET